MEAWIATGAVFIAAFLVCWLTERVASRQYIEGLTIAITAEALKDALRSQVGETEQEAARLEEIADELEQSAKRTRRRMNRDCRYWPPATIAASGFLTSTVLSDVLSVMPFWYAAATWITGAVGYYTWLLSRNAFLRSAS